MFETGLSIQIDSRGARTGAAQVRQSLQGIDQQAGRTVRGIQTGFGAVGGVFNNLRRTIFSFQGALAGLGLGFGARSIFQTAVQFERIGNQLRFATGSAEAASREFAFLREESDRLGLDLATTAESFGKLAAATKGTALEGEVTRDVFLAVAEAGTVLGLSADQMGGALTALEQIASKGTVQAEELRGQLGERLPGAFQIAARAMNVTTEELNNMLDRGDVAANEFLPAFAREVRKTFGADVPAATNSAQAALNRFNNSMADLQNSFARSGFLDVAVGSMERLQDIFEDPGFQDGVRDFGENLKGAFEFVVENHREILTALAAAQGGRIGGLPGAAIAGGATGAVLFRPELERDVFGGLPAGAREEADRLIGNDPVVRALKNLLSGGDDGFQRIVGTSPDIRGRGDTGEVPGAFPVRLAPIEVTGAAGGGEPRLSEVPKPLEPPDAFFQDIARQVRDEIQTPFERATRTIEKARDAMRFGELTEPEFQRFAELVNRDLIETMDGATAAGGRFTGEIEDGLVNVERAADRVGAAFGTAFETAIVGGNSFREVLRGLFEDLQRMVIQETVTSPLKGFLGTALQGILGGLTGGGGFALAGVGNAISGVPIATIAHGSAFDHRGMVHNFASGGVFDRATDFTFGGGKRGKMGEAGPEAVMPLERGADGRLGVRAKGGGQAGPTVYIDARGADPEGLSRVEAQLRAMNASIERRAVSAVADESRRNPRLLRG